MDIKYNKTVGLKWDQLAATIKIKQKKVTLVQNMMQQRIKET